MATSSLAYTFLGKAIKEHHMTFITIAEARLRKSILHHVMRQREVEALSLMITTSTARSLYGVTIVEANMALLAVSPVMLAICCLIGVVRKKVVEALGVRVSASGRASSFIRIPVEEEP